MKIGIIADIHSNLEALDAVLSALKKEKVDRTICLGDVVGYGPDPNACVEKVLDAADVVVAGNHDQAAIGLTSKNFFNDNARLAIEWTENVLNPEWAEGLKELPLVYEEGNLLAVHATLNEPAKWHYLFSEDEIVNNLEAMTLPLCFVGHSHVPIVFFLNPEHDVLAQHIDEIRISTGTKYLINVGSVGQPRDGDPRAAFGILEEDRFCLKRVDYDIAAVQRKMRQYKLPLHLIDRLSRGQ